MFKKLIIAMLAIGSSYAIEPIKELSSNNNIQQNTAEVKKDSNFMQSNNEKKVNLDDYNITKSRPFKTMTDDEKDWARLRIYDRFSKSCQSFIQIAFRRKNIDKKMTNFFYTTHVIRFCVLTGLEPQQIFLNELKYNIDPSCYKKQPPSVLQKFNEIADFLPRLTEGYRRLFIKKGYVDNFDM